MAILLPFQGKRPRVAESAFIAPNAVLIGDVSVEEEASIWFGAVLRGDHADHGIVVGAGSSVQDNCVVHVGGWAPTVIGKHVTVGHGAKFESCTIGDRSVIGMNAVILQNARIGIECVVAANAVVLEGADIPDRSLVAGVPGKVKKRLGGSAAEWVARGARHYIELARSYSEDGVGKASAPVCELCGGPIMERHCKVVCLSCGYQRDCSDP
jgi:carbonic anhydrase/acetyltransferase-like protein (isoleucine patch superfamily)